MSRTINKTINIDTFVDYAVENIIATCTTVTRLRDQLIYIKHQVNPILFKMLILLGLQNRFNRRKQDDVDIVALDYISDDDKLFVPLDREMSTYRTTGRIGTMLTALKNNTTVSEFDKFMYYTSIIYKIWLKCNGNDEQEDERLYALEIDVDDCKCIGDCGLLSEPNHILTKYYGTVLG